MIEVTNSLTGEKNIICASFIKLVWPHKAGTTISFQDGTSVEAEEPYSTISARLMRLNPPPRSPGART